MPSRSNMNEEGTALRGIHLSLRMKDLVGFVVRAIDLRRSTLNRADKDNTSYHAETCAVCDGTGFVIVPNLGSGDADDDDNDVFVSDSDEDGELPPLLTTTTGASAAHASSAGRTSGAGEPTSNTDRTLALGLHLAASAGLLSPPSTAVTPAAATVVPAPAVATASNTVITPASTASVSAPAAATSTTVVTPAGATVVPVPATAAPATAPVVTLTPANPTLGTNPALGNPALITPAAVTLAVVTQTQVLGLPPVSTVIPGFHSLGPNTPAPEPDDALFASPGEDRYYCVSKGIRVGVFGGWHNTSPYVTGVASASFNRHRTIQAAFAAYEDAYARGFACYV
ncbi:hypothetical protein D9611_008340 [Ephemerocybe angulata]|uniref:Ribonuclease H1 N-terminal domain-containing protein n=1 Tax=Ephemerocybe angulata TaxID=980116 RepID=A0A8H5F513_9AGAR|nr:hypothetical protein D9611_008340 [Tulosesus angulatus]